MTQTEAPATIRTAGWARKASPYDQWIETLGIPILRGYFLDDIRTCEVGWWDEQQCGAAIVMMAGQEGTAEVRVSEVPAGKTTAPVRFALDEIVYVADGRGLTNVWAEGHPVKTFEWQKHSLFMLPRGYTHQFSNTSGDRAARLLHYNSLPRAMEVLPDPKFFFEGTAVDLDIGYGDEAAFAEAKVVKVTEEERRGGAYWLGNFFPDMRAWDNLVPNRGRGAGGQVVWINYPHSAMWNHMSVFGTQTYKKAHRHGPGTLIVVPEGEGFSYLWREGEEKIYIPWHEGSVFVPPNMWFHQHFNVSDHDDRYLAFHAPGRGSDSFYANGRDPSHQIEYWQEDPIIRETFEKRLSEIGIKSLMPDECYTNPDFEWDYDQSGD
ncbi:MAG TPA: cupin domain-containing protein [Chloroflexota bacterium]